MIHVLLKPGLENFEDYFASVWDELFPEYYSKFSVGINAALEKKKKQIFFLVFIFVPVNKSSVNSQRKKEKILFRPSSGVYAKRQTLRNLQELFCLLEVEGAVIHIFEKKTLCIRWHTGI